MSLNNQNQSIQSLESPRLDRINLRVLILSIALAFILAIANVYLALKIGILASASIPAAILSMGILRFFKDTSIYQHNLVQTAASAGEAVAGGIVFTIPALIILGYWQHFPYWENFFISLLGSFAGVSLSIPLRKFLVNDPQLRFPEGRAVAEVIKAGSEDGRGIRQILSGSGIGAVIEGLQNLKILGSSVTVWHWLGKLIVGFSVGLSAILIGAGYLMGWDIALSMMVGCSVAWIFGIPVLSYFHSALPHSLSASDTIGQVFSNTLREMGVSAMLIAGLFTLFSLIKPFSQSIFELIRTILKNPFAVKKPVLATEQDLSAPVQIALLAILFVAFGLFLAWIIPFNTLSLFQLNRPELIVILLFFVFALGFVLSTITGYFSGLVGVTASPGSAVVIAGMLISGLVIKALLWAHPLSHMPDLQLLGAALTVILGALLTGMACIANDNIQDLKVGHLIGAIPRKQQIMLLLGALVASLITPKIMELLFQTYGIANVLPHTGMDPSQSLPAPPAAIMALLAKGLFQQNLEWNHFTIGAILLVGLVMLKWIAQRFNLSLSIIAMAVGMYLPMSSTTALFIGGLIARHAHRYLASSTNQSVLQQQKGYLIACGIVVGAILVDILLAIPAALNHPITLQLFQSSAGQIASLVLGIFSIMALWSWWIKQIKRVDD